MVERVIRERDHKNGTNIVRDEHTQELDTRVALKSKRVIGIST